MSVREFVCVAAPPIACIPKDTENGYAELTYSKVLGQTTERIIRPPDDDEPSSEVQHGLYIVRGDNVSVVGLVDEELDESINWNEVRGAVIGSVKHSA